MLLKILKAIGWPVFRILFAVEYVGVENVPAKGAVIVAGNHPSYLDPVLVLLPMNRPLKFMAWDALFKVPVLGYLIKAFGAFPVDLRKGKGEAAFNQALNVLNSGNALGIFPEGQRSEQGPMGELRMGVARLAIETGAPIVPVTIGGAFRAWPKWKLIPKPAKIIVRFHQPITLDQADLQSRRADKEYHREVMEQVALSINKSLTPALRSADAMERWYRQPPSHIRSYEWAPLIATVIALWVAGQRGTFQSHWPWIVIPPAIYYLYLIADLALIKPARMAKWVRNTAPIWLAAWWHYPLTGALRVPAGTQNILLLIAVLAAFFTFFYEDYFSLQKFVRGVVVSYFFALALELGWPHPLGVFVAVLVFIAIFVLWYRVNYCWLIAGAMGGALSVALGLSGQATWQLLIYAALALATNFYLQVFVSIAYDIRRAGNVATPE